MRSRQGGHSDPLQRATWGRGSDGPCRTCQWGLVGTSKGRWGSDGGGERGRWGSEGGGGGRAGVTRGLPAPAVAAPSPASSPPPPASAASQTRSPQTQTPGAAAPPPLRAPEDALCQEGRSRSRSRGKTCPPPAWGPGHLGGHGRLLPLRLLHLVQEAHDALQLGLRQQRPVLRGLGGRTQLPELLQVVGGQGAGIVLLRRDSSWPSRSSWGPRAGAGEAAQGRRGGRGRGGVKEGESRGKAGKGRGGEGGQLGLRWKEGPLTGHGWCKQCPPPPT